MFFVGIMEEVLGDPFGECGVGGFPFALEGNCVFFGSFRPFF